MTENYIHSNEVRFQFPTLETSNKNLKLCTSRKLREIHQSGAFNNAPLNENFENWVAQEHLFEQQLENNESTSTRVYKSFAYYIASYGRHSSIHGLSHTSQNYFSSNYLSKILWIIYSLLCLSALSYFLYMRMDDLINSGVNSSISSEFNRTLKFPKITICNNDGYDDTDTLVMAAKIKDYLVSRFELLNYEDPFLLKLIVVEFLASRFWRLDTLFHAGRFDQPNLSWHFTNIAKKKSFPGGLPIERIAVLPRNGSTPGCRCGRKYSNLT